MIDIQEICNQFCTDNDIVFVAETPKGINISADDLIQSKVLFWLNVIESANIGMDDEGLNIVHDRNIQIVLFKECILEDEGGNYYDELDELRQLTVKFYKYLLSYDAGDGTTFTSFMTENGVDQLDHNCVMQSIQFTVEEVLDTCPTV